MSANLKNLKMSHFGTAGFGISAGKLLANNNTNGNSGAGCGISGSGGVGGGGGGGAGAGSSKSASHVVADTDIFVTPSGTVIPLIRSRDVPKQLPTIAAALQRPADEHLAAEDLDAVQLELELMLSNVALRTRVLKAEYDSLDKDEKRQDRRKLERAPPGSPPTTLGMLNGLLGLGSNSGGGSSSGVGSPATATANSSTKRKLRDEPTGVRKKQSSMTILKQQQMAGSKHMAKNSPLATHTDDSMDYIPTMPAINHQQQQQAQQQQQILPKVAMPKNDMPNKFWLSVEPYCMPLTNEDLRLIDDLLEQYRGPLVPPVPPLGPHYSTVWAQEDMKALQPGGARQKSQNATAMLKKAEGMLEEGITGPLTQRLVSALMDESLPSEQAAVGEHSNSSSNENTHSSSTSNAAAASGNFRSLAMLKHGVGIEQRLKKELMDSGLIDANELGAHEDVDEVLLEIKRVTAEINTVAQFNSDELQRLRAGASEEIKRIELKRKLDSIDQEILECYKRMQQYRAKRKVHTNEEKQEILRLTSEQRALAEQLERMQLMSGVGDGKL
ncbi:transcriptional adapter 3 [Drosophila mojavensis]|nr:transcriptional adapter 3 [Drosophila mojavensis]